MELGAVRGNQQALEHATHALRLYQTLDNPVLNATALNSVGWCAALLGEYDQARSHCTAALALHRRHHERSNGEAYTLDSLGYIAHRTGQHARAIDYYQQALKLRRELGNTYEVANTLDGIGHPHLALGQHEQARLVWREAGELYQALHSTTDAERVQQQLNALGI
ncbi:MAG TPA: tetratricopeptide repeat protein [Actinophytocola sp.]|uniref:tetratricopeptide repeat protein n=1 Tax=Actinophytocola sp. TaxID=1872138 RepID=UPI002E0CF324|nr:tetratricopeptide repeat protein [Actinophytocola sp.]